MACLFFFLVILIVLYVSLLLSLFCLIGFWYWSSRFDVVVPCLLVSHLHSRRRHRTCLLVVHAVHLGRVCACRAERRVLWVSWGVWDMFTESCTSQFIFFRGHLVFQGFLTFVFLLPLSFSRPPLPIQYFLVLSSSSERLASESRRRLVCEGGVRRNTFSTVGTSPFIVEREHLTDTTTKMNV